jgi:hypothetical protein
VDPKKWKLSPWLEAEAVEVHVLAVAVELADIYTLEVIFWLSEQLL